MLTVTETTIQNTNRLDNVICLTKMSTNVIENDHRSANPNADLRNVNNVNSSLLNPNSNCNIGTWNVQTMYSTSKTAQIVKEMGNYQLDILGISECRWTGSGKMNTKNDKGESYTIIYSGQKDTYHLRKSPIKHDRQRRYNIARLKYEDTRKAFVLEVKNQFQKLSTDELDHPPVEERWNQIKATYCSAAESALGYLKSTDKTWLTRETWKRIEEMKTIKSKILNTKSKRIQECLQKEYSSKDKEIKRSARQDKRAYVDKLAEKAETAAQKGELSTVYRITKQLCRHIKVAASIVKDKDENALIIRKMHTGIDNICIELLKTDVITAGNIFTGLFSDIWTANEIPRDWNKGLIVKIPKK